MRTNIAIATSPSPHDIRAGLVLVALGMVHQLFVRVRKLTFNALRAFIDHKIVGPNAFVYGLDNGWAELVLVLI